MRREPSFLKDILAACRKIEAIVAATSEESFLKDEVLPAAVLHHLTVIGEAINRLSIDLRDRYPDVPIWIGRSFGTRPPAKFLELRSQVRDILGFEFSESEPD